MTDCYLEAMLANAERLVNACKAAIALDAANIVPSNENMQAVRLYADRVINNAVKFNDNYAPEKRAALNNALGLETFSFKFLELNDC